MDSLGALDELNSPIREAIIMEPEQVGSKTVHMADYCCKRDINPQSPLVFNSYLRRRARDSISLFPFGGRNSVSMRYRERANWTSMGYSNSQWLPCLLYNCRQPKQCASMSFRLWKRCFPSHVSAHGTTMTQAPIKHRNCHLIIKSDHMISSLKVRVYVSHLISQRSHSSATTFLLAVGSVRSNRSAPRVRHDRI
jgi:hypothetical protein